jgi:hypothetical protein
MSSVRQANGNFDQDFQKEITYHMLTTITVRVKTKDAKFMGSSMGGAMVMIRDYWSGELLAQGKTRGSTGNSEKIMHRPWERGQQLSDLTSACFTAHLELEEPRLIQIQAFGPLAQQQSINSVSSTQWVLPGKHITGGDAWMLEMPGFAVQIFQPPNHASFDQSSSHLQIQASLIMM